MEQLLRELAPQVLGIVARRFRDFAAAEDAVQEALLAAAVQWPIEGMPRNPRGWLVQVAMRRMTDYQRGEIARRRRESEAAMEFGYVALASSEDDTLTLLFLCCHPALTLPSSIALTLRAVGGLTTAEIARAFLVPESTMAQRISRAKQSIKISGIPFRMPSAADRGERLRAVQHVLYLIFNEGYTELGRGDLATEAIRLTRMLCEHVLGDGDTAGLLALMLLTEARRVARTGPMGELIPLTEQDRTLWDHARIAEGVELVTAALSNGAVGVYGLQAAIAALHDEAARAEDTDWAQILALYGLLLRMSDNPVIALNHAVAVAMVHGPAAGLALLAALDNDERLADSHRLDAVRAHLLERAGEPEVAIANYVRAAERTASLQERNYLLGKAAKLRENR